MATLLFSAIGAAFGGPVGAALGALAGSQVDSMIFGGSTRQGPRLQDLTVTTSTYGAALPRHFGTMRVGGTIIWATDLVEHASTSSSGKGQPSITTYSYTSSFAVALASRPILGIGRIWADGKLLRGAEGDLKVGGSLRIYSGSGDQAFDPLIASAEGIGNCPAFRGTAYVVFEDLQVADFGNRIPSLNFEVFCDDGPLVLSTLFDGVVDDVSADFPLDGIMGYSCQEALASTLSQFSPVIPMLCDAGGLELTIARERLQLVPISVGEPAVATAQGDFGGKAGYTRKRSPPPENPPRVLRYYDVALDYQPGSQRAPGRPLNGGQPKTVDLPATLTSEAAYRLISLAARNGGWALETLSWRCAELDPGIAPGAVVSLEGVTGLWRVSAWEWRETGVELTLERVPPSSSIEFYATSSGQAVLASDLPIYPTAIEAYELPWDGTGSPDASAIFAAVSSAGPGWKGAALYVDTGDGGLSQIGTSGRQRATMGAATSLLGQGPVGMFDRSSALTVKLLADDMSLSPASAQQLAQGANLALVGQELIQFGQATSLGGGVWCLEQLWRGCGGTEAAVSSHAIGDPFVLIDTTPVALEASRIPDGSDVKIGAMGVADTNLAVSAIGCRGIGRKPLAPVHAQAQTLADGSLAVSWVRRARGGWKWLDGVDEPLQEEAEAYQVGLGSPDSPIAVWQTNAPEFTFSATLLTQLHASQPGAELWVQQIGTYARSDALHLTYLAS